MGGATNLLTSAPAVLARMASQQTVAAWGHASEVGLYGGRAKVPNPGLVMPSNYSSV